MIILGKSSDDKGFQLEELTSILLGRLGYQNVSCNEILSGGSEIDVTAEFIVPGLKNGNVREIVCECKAYKNSVQLTDWLKFLGKIYSKQIARNNVDGCFIALSGVNGNVRGHYRELQRHRSNIQLISGEDLLSLLYSHFSLVQASKIISSVEALTDKAILSVSICYYEQEVYWLVSFSHERFALFTGDGKLLPANETKGLQELIIKNTSHLDFLDIQAESAALERGDTIARFIFSVLFKSGISGDVATIRREIDDDTDKERPYDFSEEDVIKGLQTLVSKGLVSRRATKYRLKVLSKSRTMSDIVAAFQFYFSKIVSLATLGCENYFRLINEALLCEIEKIQGGIKIPLEVRKDCLNVFRFSPSALFWSLKPDPMIVSHRNGGESIFGDLDKEDVDYFIQTISRLFANDFQNKHFHKFHFFTCGIHELEQESHMKVKSKSSVLISTSVSERLGLGQGDESLGGQILLLRLLSSAPAPYS